MDVPRFLRRFLRRVPAEGSCGLVIKLPLVVYADSTGPTKSSSYVHVNSIDVKTAGLKGNVRSTNSKTVAVSRRGAHATSEGVHMLKKISEITELLKH